MPKVNPMCLVTTRDYYGEIEAPFIGVDPVGYPKPGADGDIWPDKVKLKEDQLIQVYWANGNVTLERLAIRKGNSSAKIGHNDAPDMFTTQKLYIKIPYQGRFALVPLKDLKIRRCD